MKDLLTYFPIKRALKTDTSRRNLGLGLLLVIISLGIWYGTKHRISLGPTVDKSTEDVTIIYSATDHNNGNGNLLQNNITNPTDTPGYGGITDPPETLSKDANGNITNLFRVEGEIDYQ